MHIKSAPSGDSVDASASYDNIACTPDNNSSLRADSLRNRNTNFFTEGDRSMVTTGQSSVTEESDEGEKSPSLTMIPEVRVVPICARTTNTIIETFNVKVPDSEQTILVRCEKPVKLKVLLSEVQVKVALDDCKLEYNRDEKLYKLLTQKQLEYYLRLPLKRPQLYVAVPKPKTK